MPWQYASFLGSFWVQFTAGPRAGRRATGSLRRKHCDAVPRDRGILLIRHTVHILIAYHRSSANTFCWKREHGHKQ